MSNRKFIINLWPIQRTNNNCVYFENIVIIELGMLLHTSGGVVVGNRILLEIYNIILHMMTTDK